MVFGVLSIMPCATAVNDFLGVLCATFDVSCSTKCSTMWTRIFFMSLLSSIDFNVTTISCPMLRPLSCLTMFCDHKFSPFSLCSILFCMQLCKAHTTRVHSRCIHTNLNTKWRLLFKKMTSEENACRTRKFGVQ